MNYIIPFENETYTSYINRIKKINRIYDDTTHYHHIIPKCIGGLDIDENIVILKHEEHYYAHRLLANENPDNNHLVLAWTLYGQIKSNGMPEISAEEFAEKQTQGRIALSRSKKEYFQTEEGKEFLKKLSQYHSENYRGENNPDAHPVVCDELNMRWGTVQECADFFGVQLSVICTEIKKGYRVNGKYFLRYEDGEYTVKENHKKKKVFCSQLNQEFKSIKDVEKYFMITNTQAQYAIKNGKLIFGKYKIEYIN